MVQCREVTDFSNLVIAITKNDSWSVGWLHGNRYWVIYYYRQYFFLKRLYVLNYPNLRINCLHTVV